MAFDVGEILTKIDEAKADLNAAIEIAFDNRQAQLSQRYNQLVNEIQKVKDDPRFADALTPVNASFATPEQLKKIAEAGTTTNNLLIAAATGETLVKPGASTATGGSSQLPANTPPVNDKFVGLAPGTHVKLINGDVGTIGSVSPTDSHAYTFNNTTKGISQVITTGDIDSVIDASAASTSSTTSSAPAASGFQALLNEFGFSITDAQNIAYQSAHGGLTVPKYQQFQARAVSYPEYQAILNKL